MCVCMRQINTAYTEGECNRANLTFFDFLFRARFSPDAAPDADDCIYFLFKPVL